MNIKNGPITLDGTNMQNTILGSAIFAQNVDIVSVQMVQTGTPNGTWKIQVSNDKGADEGGGIPSAVITNWTDYPSATAAVSSAGSSVIKFSDFEFRWFRLVWTNTSSGNPSTATVARYSLKGRSR